MQVSRKPHVYVPEIIRQEQSFENTRRFRNQQRVADKTRGTPEAVNHLTFATL